LWIGDNALRQVAQFDRQPDGSWAFAGVAVAYQGPVAALLYHAGSMQAPAKVWVASGSAQPPVALTLGAGFAAKGVLWSKRISVPPIAPQWYRLLASTYPGDAEAHLRLFVRISNDPTPPTVNPGADAPFPVTEWRAIPYDINDAYLGGPPQMFLWVGVHFTGDRTSSPVLSQLRAEYNHEGYLAHLPEIYRAATCGDFLKRFLALFESFFEEPESAIAQLPRLFDPQSAPLEALPWLASWLALDLPGDLDEAGRRNAIANAYANDALRGTAQGLQQAQSCLAAAPAWQNGSNSVLGFTTGLAVSAPQGAVIGSTSVLDQSRLIGDDQLGAPLFDALAYQFSVLVYRGDVECAEKLAAVKAAIEIEKPAHTLYRLCIVEPEMRVGFQSRLGIDTVVAGPPQATRLGVDGGGMPGLVLGGEPAGTIGRSRVGENTWL
jgi:phage tail-like protein